MSNFKREDRYLVIKRTDAKEYLDEGQRLSLNNMVYITNRRRQLARKESLQCVVVEHDWPEYEQTWEAIRKRMEKGVSIIEHTENKYPKIIEAIRILGHDNNMPVKPIEKWPKFINYEYLESEAEKLTDDELVIMAAGEDVEQQKVMNKYEVYELDWFLNLIFDNEMSQYFYC